MMASLVVMASSCLTPRKIRFLQDMDQKRVVTLPQKFEARVSPSDQLTITIINADMDGELANPFNMAGGNYLIDVNGDIEMPIIGKMHVAGLTRLQLIDTIKTKLKDMSYMGNPFVDVRLSSFRILILSAHGSGSVSIPNERCTLLEALALSGVGSIENRRDKIGVLREIDGKMVLRYLDPRSTKVFEDPFFNLCQNDIIITDVYATTYLRDWMSGWSIVTTSLGFLSSVVSVYLLVENLIKKSE